MKDFQNFKTWLNSKELADERYKRQKNALETFTNDAEKISPENWVYAAIAASEDTTVFLIQKYHEWLSGTNGDNA